MKRKAGKILTAAAAAAAAGVVLKRMRDQQKQQEASRIRSIEEAVMNNRDYGDRQAYLIGGGLASMAAAAYLVRDCKFPGSHITIYEGLGVLGGSNDGSGDSRNGFVCRGGRMLNEETYENFWELFSSIPSLTNPGRSVTEEILNFDHAHPTHAKARLVNRDGTILDVSSMGFDNQDRLALLKLLLTDEKRLDNLTIQDWFKETTLADSARINRFCQAFTSGDTAMIEDMLHDYLWDSISIRDSAVRKGMKENFYHGMLLGLLQSQGTWSIQSNAETGEGYSDISIRTPERVGIIIEIKYAHNGNLENACAEALSQIEEKKYAVGLQRRGMKKVLKYGIAFCEKECMVVMA